MTKEYLYVGHYIDTHGNYILKIGTTNNLERRKAEHSRNYKKCKDFPLGADDTFAYDWWLPLSKYNTLRYEDKNRQSWKEKEIGEFIRNDRFYCKNKPKEVEVKIRKIYKISLS